MDILPSPRLKSKRAQARAERHAGIASVYTRRAAFFVADNAAGESIAPEPSVKDVGLIERARAGRHTRRVLLQGAGTYTPEEWLAICDGANNLCLCCGSNAPLTVDHVTPLSKGGSNTADNLQCLCRSCNSRKGTDNTDYRHKA